MFFHRKPAEPQEDLANLKVTDARAGDALSITGAAEDFSDIDFNVDRVDEYEAGEQRWRELSGEWRGRRVRLEVYSDANVEVFGNFDGATLTLDELGLSEDDLGEMDERQNPADFFDFDGKFWLYRSSREMGLFESGSGTGRGFYCWRFQEQDGKRFMVIRKFEGQPFAGTVWTKLEPSDVRVFRGT